MGAMTVEEMQEEILDCMQRAHDTVTDRSREVYQKRAHELTVEILDRRRHLAQYR